MAITFGNAASSNVVANPPTVDPAATAGATSVAIVQSNSSGSSIDGYATGYDLGRASQANTADAAFSATAVKKTMTGSEGVISPIDLSSTAIVAMLNFLGVDQTTPLDVAVVVANSNTGDTNPISASITPTTNGCMIVAAFAPDATSANDTTTTFSTTSGTTAAWTKPIDILGASSNRFQLAMGYALQTTAGAVTIQAACTGDTAGKTLYLFALREAAAAGPAITGGTANPRHLSTGNTITGTAFGASQGAGTLVIGGVTQTVTSWSDTSITYTANRGTNLNDVAVNAVVTDNSAASSANYALTGFDPPTGYYYVTLASVHGTAASRITSTADLAIGNQIEWDNADVTVNNDGTWNAALTVRRFNARIGVTTDGWGGLVWQAINLLPGSKVAAKTGGIIGGRLGL